MNLLAASAGSVTLHQVFEYLWRGFKAIPVAIYHLVVDHNAASLLQVCYLLGIILFIAVFSALVAILTTRAETKRRVVRVQRP